ncbi:hypothetical protein V1514DRAFT_106129 [Lipomyces japonicus]|uniref:uncharacterized protein n=1 Tax=Lipomyces japonicus TaxID=56871 RepID=UPI0034CE4338
MKTVALVSGGKDSCFNIIHCIKQGHDLIALANLRPPITAQSEELDSFMYQTVGHTVLDLYSKCIGVPIYRHYITGQSVDQRLEYERTDKDETEDLYELLRQVKDAHPDIEAVSVGAILSTYQRTRVENVCSRLGLTALSYLWMADQAELMDQMIASGMTAILIKVAGAGLTSERHLGKTINELRNDFFKLNARYGSHICGEGGEYETLVLDCPGLFRKKLVLDHQNVIKDESSGASEVAFLQVSAHVEDKPNDDFLPIEAPPLFEPEFHDLYQTIKSIERPSIDHEQYSHSSSLETPPISIGVSPETITISNITAPYAHDLESEIMCIFESLDAILTTQFAITDPYAIVSVTLLLSDMKNFAAANVAYKAFFSSPPRVNPPSRTCVSTSLPSRSRVSLSAIIARDPSARSGLHVQGRSYWAPANIGPYSQAITLKECIYLAGQVPLVPAQMVLYNSADLPGQAVLALQNLKRVLSAVVADNDTPQLFYAIAYAASEEAALVALRAAEFSNFLAGCAVFAIHVAGLPVGALIEWGGIGVNERYNPVTNYDDDDDDDNDNDLYSAVFRSVKGILVQSSYGKTWFAIFTANRLALNKEFLFLFTLPANKKFISIAIYISDGAEASALETLEDIRTNGSVASVDIYHVKSVFSKEGLRKNYGVIVRGYIE